MHDGLRELIAKADREMFVGSDNSSRAILYEFLAHVRSLSAIDETKGHLTPHLFDSTRTFESFREFRDDYLDFFSEILAGPLSKQIFFNDIFNPNSNYGKGYCRKRGNKPVICK